jgi:prevent-host-death family protein
VSNAVIKDPNFPMEHAQISDLKSKAPQLFERVRHADVMITRNGETLGYVVSPEHFQFLVDAVVEAGASATKTFLNNHAKRHGNLDRLDAAWQSAQRGEMASRDDEASVFGDE